MIVGSAKNLGGSSSEKKITYKTPNLKDYDTNSLYSYYGGGSSSGGGGGGYSVAKADISGLLDSYEQQAAAARQNAETKYNNTRSDLLTSLKRFQEQNAQDLERYRNQNAQDTLNQKQGYLATQASLDFAREQANRQNRIAASARGLGGSGLQQLAQLQTLMAQGEDISNAASENQKAMDKLATLLREYEADSNKKLQEYQEDSDTKLRQNEEERANTLNSIASALANQRANAIAQNEQAYVNALNSARAQAAAARASSSSSNASARQAANAVSGSLRSLTTRLNDELKDLNGMNKTAVKKYMKDTYGVTVSGAKEAKNQLRKLYMDELDAIQSNYAFGSDTYDLAYNNINTLLNGLGVSGGTTTTATTTKKTSNNKNKGFDWTALFPIL